MSGTSNGKDGPAFAGDLDAATNVKTRATAEAASKKRQFCKPLPLEFRRNGFNYRQIAREGDVAIYEQKWLGCGEAAPAYEVVRIRRREGFRIDGRFVEPSEVYPKSESWGVDDFTFTGWKKAQAKFLKCRWKNQRREERR